jgi:DNA-binding MarR family transcriptional regulator
MESIRFSSGGAEGGPVDGPGQGTEGGAGGADGGARGGAGAERRRGTLNLAIRESVRDLGVQLSLLNHRIGGHLDLKGSDLECLDLIDRFGPVSPSALARRAGLHPATMTGVMDRLEKGGWITRERDPDDRRGVVLHPVRSRRADFLRLAAGMSASMAQICAGYTDDELDLIAGFLRRTAEAGRSATEELDGK